MHPPTLRHFIAGSEQSGPRAGETLLNPATGASLAYLPEAMPAEVNAAVESAVMAAKEKFAWWAARTPEQRALVLQSLANSFEQRASDLTFALAQSEGMPLALAREVELPAAVRNLRYWASRIVHEGGRAQAESQGSLSFTFHPPVGVAAILLPAPRSLWWFTQLVGAALAAGNTTVVNPSPAASFTMGLIGGLLNEAGVPPGSVNLLYGGEETRRLLASAPAVGIVACAGSAPEVRALGAQAAQAGKNFFGEEGGRQAMVVLGDADLSEAAIAGVRGTLSSINEAYLDASLLLVEESAFSAFAEKFARTAGLLRVGSPEERNTQVGPLRSEAERAAFYRFVKESSGRVVAGGGPSRLTAELASGFFVEPTVLSFSHAGELPAAPPGPLACLAPFRAPELIEILRAGEGFHAISLWGRDMSRLHKLARSLPAGTVVVNAWAAEDAGHPMGAAKRSSFAAQDLLAAFRRRQSVHVAY